MHLEQWSSAVRALDWSRIKRNVTVIYDDKVQTLVLRPLAMQDIAKITKITLVAILQHCQAWRPDVTITNAITACRLTVILQIDTVYIVGVVLANWLH